MGFIEKITSMPQVFSGLMCGFIAILGVRVTYPFASAIFDMWTGNSMLRVSAVLAMWLIYIVVLWGFVWMKFFEPKRNTG